MRVGRLLRWLVLAVVLVALVFVVRP